MVVAEALFVYGIYKDLRSAHAFLTEFNARVMRSATLKGVLEITKDDVRNVEVQLRKIERLQKSVADEHRWRLRQREAITARRDAATDAVERARWDTDLRILGSKIGALESTGAALNKKEATLHNIDTLLKKAETLGVERAGKLRRAGEVPVKELDALGIDIHALSSKLDDEHKATENLLAWLEKESRSSTPAKA